MNIIDKIKDEDYKSNPLHEENWMVLNKVENSTKDGTITRDTEDLLIAALLGLRPPPSRVRPSVRAALQLTNNKRTSLVSDKDLKVSCSKRKCMRVEHGFILFF